MVDDDVHPMALLTEEVKADEVETRIKAVRRLTTVAQALGLERTRSELVPFLREITEDEDEVLMALAEELGGFVSYVGGPQYAVVLVEPLETLAYVEETVVREKAVASLLKVVDVMPNVADVFTPLMKRLTEGDWFTSRVSACSLFAAVYSKIPDPARKKELRDFFQLLSSDDTPMVRRAVASIIAKFAESLEKDHISGLILPIFKALCNDDQDSVRLLAIENSAPIAKLLSMEESSTSVLPIVRTSVEDRSWRVRFTIAKDFFSLSEAMGQQITESELLSCFTNLLQDAEAEVRAASAKNIAGYITIVRNELFTSEIIPLLSALAQDTAPNVRTSISIACMELAPHLGEAAAKSTLGPLLLMFLRDEVVDVRLNILKRLGTLSMWMSAFESTLLPAISELSRDLQWRVREAVIMAVPALASSLGNQYFQEHLQEMYVSAFTDMVGQVRLSATTILPQLIASVGSDYIAQHIMPRLLQIFEKSTIYQERVNVLHALKQLGTETTSNELIVTMITLALRGARDKIPNVRFVASITLEHLCKYADSSIVAAQVRPCLSELTNDSDADVKYYSIVAMESVQV